MNDNEIDLHWYCFSFKGLSINNSELCEANTYTGYKNKIITIKRIAENKEYAEVKDNAVLMSVSYLGYMSKNYFMESF